jgi:hypothetical protein
VKWRVVELFAAGELTREEARDVVSHRVRERDGIRLEGLDDHLPGRVAAAASGKLGDELKGPLLDRKSETEARIRIPTAAIETPGK